MSDLLVRNVELDDLANVKAEEPGRNGRLSRPRLSRVLDEAARAAPSGLPLFGKRRINLRQSLKGRPQSDSTLAIREDRDSDYGHDA